MRTESKYGFYTFGRFQTSESDFKEVVNKKDFISFGDKNDFPQELIRLYETSSPLHSALIDKTALMTAGAGFNKEQIGDSFKEQLFFKNRFSQDNLDQIAEKCAFDLALANCFYLNIIWDATGKNIAQIEHVPFETVRVQKSFDRITGYYVSRDWQNLRKSENKEVLYPAFNRALAAQDPESRSQILAVQVYTAGMQYYSLPSYKSSLDSIKANYELNLFHLKSIQNGFNAGMILTMKGEYTPEEQDELYQDIKGKYTGADNAGEFIMLFAPSTEAVPEITPIELQATDQRFLDLKESIIEDIIEGHKATSAVAGREVSGKLGSRQEIEEQHDIFNKVVIEPYQKKIEDAFNMLAKVNGLSAQYTLNSYNFFEVVEVEDTDNKAAVLDALNSLSPLVANKVLENMTKDEIRNLIGLEAMPEEQETSEEENNKNAA